MKPELDERHVILHSQISSDDAVARSAIRRIRARLIPYLFLLYIVSYLDRVNLGYAGLKMPQDLGFSDKVFGLGAGIFFIGYFILEIPGTILVETWSAKAWIARIMITWGILAALTGLIHSSTQFYLIRFFLGAAEAGFFPGILVYLTHWFPERERGLAIGLFMTAVPLSNLVGLPISGFLLGVHWFGLAGWRWLLILEGLPAVVLGLTTIFYLTNRPAQAKWLPEQEKRWLIDRLQRERLPHPGIMEGIKAGLRNRAAILLALSYFLIITGVYGLNFWLPTIIKRLSGFPNVVVTLLSALPFVFALIAMLVMGWSSDRTGERKFHAAIPMLVAGVGLIASGLLQNYLVLEIGAFCVAAAGLYSFFPGFWALPSRLLGGTAAAAAIGLINSIGNLGGFAGPYVVGWVTNSTGSFLGGLAYLSFSALLGGIILLAGINKQIGGSNPANSDWLTSELA